MEFLNPAAFYALFFLPLIVVPYLIRRKPRQVLFSSLLLFRDLSLKASGRPWGRLRLTPLFFLQLLLLLVLIATLAEPVFPVRLMKVAVVLDNSASMQALDGKKTRFQTAQAEIRGLLQELSARARVEVFLTVPTLERIGTLPPSSALALVESLAPYDLGEPAFDYGQAILNLTRDTSYGRIYFLTDHPVRGESARIKVITVGQPRDNLAITSFRVTQGAFATARLQATAQVRSFSAKEEKVTLSLIGNGKTLSSRSQTVKPGESVQAGFEGFAPAPYYEAKIDNHDALPLDNHRFAAPPPITLKILAVAPRPGALESLRLIPGTSLSVVSPGVYEKQSGRHNQLEIFYYSAPRMLPRANALFILPPAQNPLVTLGKVISNPRITGWDEPHTLTRYINFSLFRPAYAYPMKVNSFGQAIIRCPEGALAIAAERGGFRYLVLGFDPFPYIGRKNLPISIFTLNILEWFYDGMWNASSATGQPLNLGDRPEAAFLKNPRGEKFALKPGPSMFPQTLYQGIYEMILAGKREFRAVNLENEKESDLRHPAIVDLRDNPAGPNASSSLFFLWPYLLLLSLVLLFLEWYLSGGDFSRLGKAANLVSSARGKP